MSIATIPATRSSADKYVDVLRSATNSSTPRGASAIQLVRSEVSHTHLTETSILVTSYFMPEGWRLKAPIPVRVSRDEFGTYIAVDDLFATYGDGDTALAAVVDYAVSLVELFEMVAAGAEQFEDDARDLQAMSQYISRVSQ